jgi:hypothetical protein
VFGYLAGAFLLEDNMHERVFGTYFMDRDGNLLGDYYELLPIPLFKGMKITIHSCDREFEVVDWNFHHGHPDEKAGLRIILE